MGKNILREKLIRDHVLKKMIRLTRNHKLASYNFITSILDNDIDMMVYLIINWQFDSYEQKLLDNGLMIILASYTNNIEIVNIVLKITAIPERSVLLNEYLHKEIIPSIAKKISNFYKFYGIL